ncbi:MAG: HEAT repeat domain-containing protein [Thermogutta sp.]
MLFEPSHYSFSLPKQIAKFVKIIKFGVISIMLAVASHNSWAIAVSEECGVSASTSCLAPNSPNQVADIARTPSAEQSVKLLDRNQCLRNLAEGTIEEKILAIRSLVSLRDSAIQPILGALDDEDASVRAEAIKALGELAPAEAEVVVPRLVQCIEKDEGLVDEKPNWIRASQAIGKYGEKALPLVQREWESANPQRRAILCLICYELGPAAAPMVPKLAEVAEGGHDICRRAAIGALMAIGQDAAPAVPRLQKLLYHEDFHTQYWACRALAAIGPAALPAVPDLIDRLKNGVASVRRNAAAALGKLGPDVGEEAVAALIEAVDDPLQPVREQAVLALGRLGPNIAGQARPAIEASHQKRPIFPNSAATWAIWRLGGPSEPLVASLIADIKEGIYREEATQLLGDMGDEKQLVVGKLKDCLSTVAESNPEEAANIQRTLQEIGEKKPNE